MPQPHRIQSKDNIKEDFASILNDLKAEIEHHPDQKHRILLRAIQTAECRELKKAIRHFCQQSYEFD